MMIGAVRRSRKFLVVAMVVMTARPVAGAGPACAGPPWDGPPDSVIAPPGQAGQSGRTVQATQTGHEGDPGATSRLLFLPDARPLRSGGGYVALHDLFIPSFAIGINGFFSVAAGASIVPGLDRQVVMISPKVVPFSTDGLAIAAGAVYAARRGDEGAGIVFAEMTAGGGAGSGTFGLGWSAAGAETGGRPVFIAGFRVPVAGGSEIVSENWFPPNFDPAVMSIGWRYSTGRIAVDLAACLPAQREGGGASFVPWVTLAYHY